MNGELRELVDIQSCGKMMMVFISLLEYNKLRPSHIRYSSPMLKKLLLLQIHFFESETHTRVQYLPNSLRH